MKKALSFIVAVCLLLSVFAGAAPAVAVEEIPAARSAESQSGAQPEAAAPAVTEQEEVTVIREEESLRGEYEKHFLMSDGTYQAVVYSYPVHELVDGVWVEVEATNPNARGDVTTDSTKSNIIDNYVLKGYGVQNKSLDRLYIGNRSAGLTRAYIQFAAMPTIPAGATITAATMTLHFTSGTNTAANASAYQVTGGEWASGTIQWSNKPAADISLQENISHNNVTGYVFSCLTAVQHWYDGDTTGQNENYGIMLRYYNESTADYNAVYSADYSDATKRPSLRISYDPLSFSVQEGISINLPAPSSSGTVTWASSDVAVARVTSAGYLTGVKAGATTVTASVDGTIVKEYSIYVTVPEGVYYIKDGDGLFLGTSGGVADGTNTVLQAKALSGRAQLNQLWRIDHLRNGYYSIRPLYKLNMGLTSENGNAGAVEITTIGTTDSWAGVSGANRWTITYDSGGYVFCCAGTSYMTMYRPQPNLGGSVMTAPSSTAASECKWLLEGVSSVTNQLLLMDAQTGASVEGKTFYINHGETVTPDELGIVASFVCGYSLDQSISWYSQNSANVSINSSTGAMTPSIPDRSSTIYAKHFHNGVEYSNTFTIVVNKQMTQFIDKMGDLYDVAYAYVGEKQTEAFEMMFNFIRGQKNEYNDDMWQGVVGEWNTTFVSFVKTKHSGLYSYFISESEKDMLKVSDTCTNGYIDVPHLAATLNRLFYTGDTYYNGINTLGLYDEEADALSGWAGDCQTLIKRYLKNYKEDSIDELYIHFYPMIGNESYDCGYTDIITDLDACNLSTILWGQSITTGEQLENVLYSYYFGTEGNIAAKRFTTWIGSYTEDDLWYKFRDYCNDYSTFPTKKWPILAKYDITDDQQKKFSQAFANYFWAQKVKE